jgi:phosphoribosylamine--glycine ligase
MYSKGSRVFEIVCSGGSYGEAYERAERAVTYVRSLDGWPLFYRSDIGSRELLEDRIRTAERVRTIYSSRGRRGLLGKVLVWVPGEGISDNPLVGFVR